MVAVTVSGRLQDDDLKRHIAQCDLCRDVLFVSSLLHEDCGGLDTRTRVPGGALVWWRAAVRSKIEAEQQISRPLTWAYGLTSAVVAGLAASAIRVAWPVVEGVSTAAAERMAASDGLFGGAALVEAIPPGVAALAIGTLAVLVLVPVAAYMALGDRN